MNAAQSKLARPSAPSPAARLDLIHVVDLVGGLVFGLLVGHVIPLDPEPLDRIGPRHRTLAGRYGLGALALGAMALIAGGAWFALLWSAVSLMLVATA